MVHVVFATFFFWIFLATLSCALLGCTGKKDDGVDESIPTTCKGGSEFDFEEFKGLAELCLKTIELPADSCEEPVDAGYACFEKTLKDCGWTLEVVGGNEQYYKFQHETYLHIVENIGANVKIAYQSAARDCFMTTEFQKDCMRYDNISKEFGPCCNGVIEQLKGCIPPGQSKCPRIWEWEIFNSTHPEFADWFLYKEDGCKYADPYHR